MKKIIINSQTFFKLTALISSMAWSGLSLSAALINGDFTSGFDSWQGDVTSYGTIDPLPAVPTDPYSANFNAATGAAVLSTSYDDDGINFSVNLFQSFDLAANALSLTFDYEWASDDPSSDFWQAQLIDTSDPAHFLTFISGAGSGSGSFDLSSFGGLTVQLLFGLQNNSIGISTDDMLTIDNIAITERQPNDGTVPEPGNLLLLAVGLAALKCKKS